MRVVPIDLQYLKVLNHHKQYVLKYLSSRDHVSSVKSKSKSPNKDNCHVDVFHLEMCLVPYWINQLGVSEKVSVLV